MFQTMNVLKLVRIKILTPLKWLTRDHFFCYNAIKLAAIAMSPTVVH